MTNRSNATAIALMIVVTLAMGLFFFGVYAPGPTTSIKTSAALDSSSEQMEDRHSGPRGATPPPPPLPAASTLGEVDDAAPPPPLPAEAAVNGQPPPPPPASPVSGRKRPSSSGIGTGTGATPNSTKPTAKDDVDIHVPFIFGGPIEELGAASSPPRPLQVRSMCEPYSLRVPSHITTAGFNVSEAAQLLDNPVCRGVTDLAAVRLEAPKRTWERFQQQQQQQEPTGAPSNHVDAVGKQRVEQCLRRETGTYRGINRALAKGNGAVAKCMTGAVEKFRNSLRRRMNHTSALGGGDKKATATGEKQQQNVLITISLGSSFSSKGQGERRLLMWSWLRSTRPKRDVAFFIADFSTDKWQNMARSLRLGIYRQRRMAQWKREQQQQQQQKKDGGKSFDETPVNAPAPWWMSDNSPKDIDDYVSQIYVVWKAEWRSGRGGSPTNTRIDTINSFLNSAYFRQTVPNVGLVVGCDSRDTLFQANPFDAFDSFMNNKDKDNSGASSSVPFVGAFVVAETYDMYNHRLNRGWLRHYLGREGDHAVLVEDGAKLRGDLQELAHAPNVPRVLPSGKPLPVLCSGLWGGTLDEVRQLIALHAGVVGCGAGGGMLVHGRDQPAMQALFLYVGPLLDALHFELSQELLEKHGDKIKKEQLPKSLPLYIINPLVGGFARHFIATKLLPNFPSRRLHWDPTVPTTADLSPRDAENKLLSCDGRVIGIVHQLDRHSGKPFFKHLEALAVRSERIGKNAALLTQQSTPPPSEEESNAQKVVAETQDDKELAAALGKRSPSDG